MTVKIPEFKRCCFCIPLAAGLYVWCYFKIIVDILITPIVECITILLLYTTFNIFNFEAFICTLILITLLIVLVADFVATFVFIVGDSKTKVDRIRGYYIFSIVELIMMAVLTVAAVGISIAHWHTESTTKRLVLFTIYSAVILVLSYFVLLLRSELIRIKGLGETTSVENTTEGHDSTKCLTTSYRKEAAIENV